MKSFFIKKQLHHCNSTISHWIRAVKGVPKALVLLSFGLFLSGQVFAQAEHDGDPADWQNLITNNNFLKINNPRVDLMNSGTDEALGSGAKDVNDFPLWHWSYQTNDKTDIHGATIVLLPGNIVRFAADRFAQNGDAEIGIWLLKGPLSANADGTFTGPHTNGDVLITSKFTNGGGVSTITVRTWQNGILSTAIVPLSGKARVNSSEKDVPAVFRTFQSKFGDLNKYPKGAFFEGILDLDDIEGNDNCFTRFLFETSQSQSNNEALGDFLLGNFNTKPDAPTVTNVEKCYDGTKATATASCGTANGTLIFYTASSGGSVVADPSRTAVGVSTFYAACNKDGCESDRVAVTATIFPLPEVDGVITEGENANFADGGPDDGIEKVSDDIYRIRISRTATASLAATASGGTGSYTYVWTRINCDGTAFVDDGKTTFTSTGANGTFTVLPNPINLALAYCFKVTVTDGKTCVATDIVQIRPTFACPPCGISGPATACKDAQATYTYVSPLTGLPAALPTDYDLTWTKPDGTTVTNVTSITVPLSTTGTKTVSISFAVKSGGVSGNCPGCNKSTDVRQVTLSLEKRDLTCYQSGNGRITATFANGFSPYSISLNGATTANVTSQHVFNNLAAGTYTVVITDAQNCTDTKQITLTEPPLLTCSLTTPGALTCGASGTVSGTITGGTAGYTCSATFDAAGTAGGWTVTNCSVSGSNITVSYTSGAAVPSSVLTVTVRDANGCTSTCSTTVQCTGGHGCTPGYWQGGNGKDTWDEATDPVAIAAGFTTNTSFYAVFPGVAPGTCGLPTTLKMIDAITLGGGNCNKLVRHGVAGILNASTLPDYPLPAGIHSVAALKASMASAINACDCEALASAIAANNELNHDLCGQVLTSVANSFVSGRTIREQVADDLEMQAYPNPYNNVVNFRFASPKTGKAVLEVYDIVGRRLAVVYQGSVTAKTPISVKYNVPSLSRVALFYKLTVDNKSVRGSVLPDKQ